MEHEAFIQGLRFALRVSSYMLRVTGFVFHALKGYSIAKIESLSNQIPSPKLYPPRLSRTTENDSLGDIRWDFGVVRKLHTI